MDEWQEEWMNTQMSLWINEWFHCAIEALVWIINSSLASYSSAHTVQDLLPHEKLSCWLCSTVGAYLKAYWVPVSSIKPSRTNLRSSTWGHVVVLPDTNTYDLVSKFCYWIELQQVTSVPFANILWTVPQAPENLTFRQWRHWPGSGAPLI